MRIFAHNGPIRTSSTRTSGYASTLGICIAAALLITASAIPAGAEESIWTHNGSTVR